MTDWMWFLVYFLPGALMVARMIWVDPIGERPDWSDFMMVPVAAWMWPLMLGYVFEPKFWERPEWRMPKHTTFEQRDAALEAAYQEAIAEPIEPRLVPAWEPFERDIFGINATDEFIIATAKTLRNIEWDRLAASGDKRGIVLETNGERYLPGEPIPDSRPVGPVFRDGEWEEVRAWGQVELVKVAQVPTESIWDRPTQRRGNYDDLVAKQNELIRKALEG